MYRIHRLIPVLLLVCSAGARPLLDVMNAAPNSALQSHSFSRRDNPLTAVICPLLEFVPLTTIDGILSGAVPPATLGLPGITTIEDLIAALAGCGQSAGRSRQDNLGGERNPTQDSANPALSGGDPSGAPGTFQRFASAPDPSGGSLDNSGTGNAPNSGTPVNPQGQPNSSPNTPTAATNGPAANNGNSGSNSNGPSPGANSPPAVNDARVAATANTNQNQNNIPATTDPNAQSNQSPSSPAAGTSGNSAPSPNVNQSPSANGGSGFQPYGSSGDNTVNDASNTNSNRPNSQTAQRNSNSIDGNPPLLGVAPLSAGGLPTGGSVVGAVLSTLPGNPFGWFLRMWRWGRVCLRRTSNRAVMITISSCTA